MTPVIVVTYWVYGLKVKVSERLLGSRYVLYYAKTESIVMTIGYNELFSLVP